MCIIASSLKCTRGAGHMVTERNEIVCILFVLQDLVKSTPTSHADYDVLQKALSSAQNFIENFDGTYKDSVRQISSCLKCNLCDNDDTSRRNCPSLGSVFRMSSA